MLAAIWSVLLELSPWLLLGMVIAGVLHGLLPRNFVHRQLRGWSGVLKAVALGVPLPLCSCGTIPAALGLKRDGASDGASVGFLISTPQTGVDSVLVTSAFLGWPFAVFKVVSAAVTGIVGGLITHFSEKTRDEAPLPDVADEAAPPRGIKEMLLHAIQILRSIWVWIVVGVVVSAALEVFVPAGLLAGLADRGPIVPSLAALLVSLPLYVCATASVPIAAALVAGGMPAGAALVFLMAGPATNLATIGAVHRALGRRALTIYLATIVAGSILFGLTFDFLLEPAVAAPAHVHGRTSWWAVASAVALLALMAGFAFEDVRGRLRRGATGQRDAALELSVQGMTCAGCVSRLERALGREQGVTSVVVHLDPGKAVVRGSIDPDRVRRIVERLGFRAL